MLSEILQQQPVALGDSDYALRAQASSVVHIGSQPLARLRRPSEHSSEAIDVVDAMESASASSHHQNTVVGVSIWRVVLVLALAVESFAVPFRAVFDQQDESEFTILKEHWWLLDVLLCFLLAWHVLVGLFETPSVVFRSVEGLKDLRASRAYLRGRFAFDALVALPFEQVLASIIDGSLSGGIGNHGRRCVMLVRLIRIRIFFDTLSRWSENPKLPFTMFALITFVFSVMLILHLSTCAWFLPSLLCGHASGSWTARYGFDPGHSSVSAQYTAALYWATQTLFLVGYGDVVAVLPSELGVSIVIALVGSIMFSFIIANVQLMQEHFFSSAGVYHTKVALTFDYCERHGIPESLKHRIRNFFEYCYRVRPFVDEADLLSAMSPSLRAGVVLVMNGAILSRIPVFVALGEGFQTAMAMRLVPSVCAREDILVRQGEVGLEMYVLSRGTIEIVSSRTPFHPPGST
jgi:voltage-gated potassium channel